MKKKKVFSLFPKRFKAKYSVDERVPSSGIYECSLCNNYTAFKKGETFTRCEDCVNEGRSELNQWYVTNEVIHFMSKNLNIEFEKIETLELKLADKITEFSGSMGFVYLHTVWFGLWIGMNEGWFGRQFAFDPYPYGLLTMIVSLEAIYLATFIMISQNIFGKKAELRAEHEYEINLKAEKEVAEILTMVKEIKEEYSITKKGGEELKEEVKKLRKVKAGKKVKKKSFRRMKKAELEKEESLLRESGIYMIKEPRPERE
jgi:uncharacterized membrane protein